MDWSGLWKNLFALGNTEEGSITLVNAAQRIKKRLEKNTAHLYRDESVGSKFALTLDEAMWDRGQVISQAGTHKLDLNKEFAKCSCMAEVGKGRARDQQKEWCPHKVTVVVLDRGQGRI